MRGRLMAKEGAMKCCGFGKDGYVRSEVAKRRHFLSSIAVARSQLPFGQSACARKRPA
uniref:Uncharacterized protein n=1 Tax=Magnetococcus massalia (strain MO-1) TaxID=451514 RepID=A0A1S7LHK7_MAGMO|nr:protein of unknown function [Candidatus Magnetococcus massalia]